MVQVKQVKAQRIKSHNIHLNESETCNALLG